MLFKESETPFPVTGATMTDNRLNNKIFTVIFRQGNATTLKIPIRPTIPIEFFTTDEQFKTNSTLSESILPT